MPVVEFRIWPKIPIPLIFAKKTHKSTVFIATEFKCTKTSICFLVNLRHYIPPNDILVTPNFEFTFANGASECLPTTLES